MANPDKVLKLSTLYLSYNLKYSSLGSLVMAFHHQALWNGVNCQGVFSFFQCIELTRFHSVLGMAKKILS